MKSKTSNMSPGLIRGGAIALAAACLGPAVHAADSTITVTGTVYAEPCTVASGSASISIDLGRVPTKNLQTAGSSTDWSAVKKIVLTSCPAGTKSAIAAFSGTADPNQTDTFKNTGTAQNVSVWLASDSGGAYTTIKAGDTRTATIANSGAEFAIKARLYSKSGGVTPGSVSSTISVTLSYQ